MAGVESGQLRENLEPPAVKPRRRISRRQWCLLAFATGLVVLYALRAHILPLAARFLDVSETPQQVDYAMVLGGGIDTRPFVAAALVRAGLANGVLVPKVKRSPAAEEQIVPPEHELILKVLGARGVPRERVILLPGEVTSTADEARALATFLASQPVCSVAVVTNTLHTRRARAIFRRTLGANYPKVHFVGAPTDGYDQSNWWRFERGWVDYATEYAKFFFHLLPVRTLTGDTGP